MFAVLWLLARPFSRLTRGLLLVREDEPCEDGSEHQEDHPDARRITGEINDRNDEEDDAS
jgi:hypothetical protein